LIVGEFEFFIRVSTTEGATRTVLLHDKRGLGNQSSRIKVVPGVTSALFSSVSSSGFENIVAGVAHEVEFAARDSNGLPKITGGDPFRVLLRPASTPNGKIPQPSEYSCSMCSDSYRYCASLTPLSGILDLQNGSYRLSITAEKAGKYDAHIFLGQQEILGSPMTVCVAGGPPSSVHLADASVILPHTIVAGEVIKFPIACEDRFGNSTYASADKISITFETASSVVSEDVVAHIESVRHPNHSISYMVAFGCTRSIKASVSVRSNDGVAGGASVNWKVFISPEVISQCEFMDIPASVDADTAQRMCVRFKLLDKFKNVVGTLANASNLDFQLRQLKEEGKFAAKISGLTLAEDAAGAGVATFCLSTVGQYQLSITFKGVSLASKKFVVVPGRPNPDCCHASKLPRVIVSRSAQTGFGFSNSVSPQVSPEYSVIVEVSDSYQNSAQSSNLDVSWVHSPGSPTPSTSVRAQTSSSFQISFKIDAPGKYFLAVTLEGAHIRGSPFALNAMPHLPDFTSKRKWVAREILNYNASGPQLPRGGFGGFSRPVLGFGGGGPTFNLSGSSPDVLLNESLETILRMDDIALKSHWRVNFKNSEAVDGGTLAHQRL
jgi:hypothetical protein